MRREKNGKLIRLLLMVAAMIMLLAVPVQAQASAKSTYKKGVTYYKNGKYKKARQQFKKLRKKANESCVKTMSSKMKRAYLKKVKKYPEFDVYSSKPYLWGYYLTDMDQDGKAELIVKHGTCEADVQATVYKYKGGKAKKIGSFYCAHSTFYYDPRGGLAVTNCYMFAEQIYTVKIKNGKLKLTTWNKQYRSAKSMSDYMYLPYLLDSHQGTDKNYNIVYDYSDLK